MARAAAMIASLLRRASARTGFTCGTRPPLTIGDCLHIVSCGDRLHLRRCRMRVLMFARGVIATTYGRELQGAGHDVEFYVRPGRAAEYGTEVRMSLRDGRRNPFAR